MDRRSTRVLLWCGALGGPLFVIVALVEGSTRTGYDALRLPISLLSLGPLGWTQTANFIVGGGLMIAFAVGLSRSLSPSGWPSRVGPILLTLFGLGLVGAGIFPADPGGGYPPGVGGSGSSGTGTQHDLSTLLVFGALVASSVVIGAHFAAVGQTGWAAYSILT